MTRRKKYVCFRCKDLLTKKETVFLDYYNKIGRGVIKIVPFCKPCRDFIEYEDEQAMCDYE